MKTKYEYSKSWQDVLNIVLRFWFGNNRIKMEKGKEYTINKLYYYAMLFYHYFIFIFIFLVLVYELSMIYDSILFSFVGSFFILLLLDLLLAYFAPMKLNSAD